MPKRKSAAATEDVSLLGHDVAWPQSPEEATLERVPNPHPDKLYLARFTAPEFTSLCPVTGQPDFAHLVIDYVPRRWLVEFGNGANPGDVWPMGLDRNMGATLRPEVAGSRHQH